MSPRAANILDNGLKRSFKDWDPVTELALFKQFPLFMRAVEFKLSLDSLHAYRNKVIERACGLTINYSN
jgi:hypothetical protein